MRLTDRSTLVPFLVVAIVAAVVLFFNLGGPLLWDRDEPRNAGCAAEMLARHDWVVPVFNAELRTHKPVLLYWLMISAYQMFGMNEFAARFWSAALGVATCLATCFIGRRLFNPAVGLWSGLALSSCLMFDVAARAATPDSVLICCGTAALAIFVWGAFPAPSVAKVSDAIAETPTLRVAAATYAVLGLGLLAKGPVGLVLPAAVIGLYLLIQTHRSIGPAAGGVAARLVGMVRVFHPLHFARTCWRMRPLTAIAIAGAVALPWYIWVGVRTDGQFLRSFFLDHNLGRATHTLEGHGGNLLFYPAALLVGTFPWSVLAVPAAWSAWRESQRHDRDRAAHRFLVCWIGVYVGLFSLAQTKLPSYITPCHPAFAILIGAYLDRWLRGVDGLWRPWPVVAFSLLSLIGLAIGVGLYGALGGLFPDDRWLAAIGAVPLVGGVAAAWTAHRGWNHRAAHCLAATAAVFSLLLLGVGADRVSRHQQQRTLLDALPGSAAPWRTGQASSAAPPAAVASFGLIEPTWIVYGGRPIVELSDLLGDPAGQAWVEQNGRWVKRPATLAADFWRASDEPYIITTADHWPTLRERLDGSATIVATAPYFLQEQSLVLIGRSDRGAGVASALRPTVAKPADRYNPSSVGSRR